MKENLLTTFSEPEKFYIEEINNKYNSIMKDFKIGSLEDLLKSILEIKVNDDSIYIKLNKNLIIESNNFISISKDQNIQLAKRIHLNPRVN